MIVASLDGTVSVISTVSDTVTHTLTLPNGTDPSAAGYVVYSPVSKQIYVGDTANSRVVAYRTSDLGLAGILATDSDAFHMWTNGNQLWVVDRTAKSAIVFDVNTQQRLATVGVPEDLQQAGGVPHDVTLDGTHAFLTVLGLAGVPDVVVKFDRVSFQEVARVNVGEDPHVFLNPTNSELYAACEGTDNVFILNRTTLQVLAEVEAAGAHGTWVPSHGNSLFTTNFPGHTLGGTVPGLIAIDLNSRVVAGSVPPPVPRPHNVFGTADGTKAYVTHTDGGTTVSVYSIDPTSGVPRFLTQVAVGVDPFGITLFPGE